MNWLEIVGAVALWVGGWWIAGCLAFIAVTMIWRKQLDQMELAGIVPPLYAALGVWGIGAVGGLMMLGRIF